MKSARKQKDLIFVDVNDGSVLNSLQVVAPSDQLEKYDKRQKSILPLVPLNVNHCP